MSRPLPPPIRNATLRLPVLSLREAKRQAIILAMQIHQGRLEDSARCLGISKSGLYKMTVALDIHRQHWDI